MGQAAVCGRVGLFFTAVVFEDPKHYNRVRGGGLGAARLRNRSVEAKLQGHDQNVRRLREPPPLYTSWENVFMQIVATTHCDLFIFTVLKQQYRVSAEMKF